MADRASFEPSESYYENKVVAWAKARGILCPKLSTPGQRGYPDRIFFIPGGAPVLVEFKRKGAKPRKLQRYVMNQLDQLDYHVVWSDNHEEIISLLEWKLAKTAQLPEKGSRVAGEPRRSGRSLRPRYR